MCEIQTWHIDLSLHRETKLKLKIFLMWSYSAELNRSAAVKVLILFSDSLSQQNAHRQHTLPSTTSSFTLTLVGLHTHCPSKHSPPLLATKLLHSSSWQLSHFDQRPAKRSCWRKEEVLHIQSPHSTFPAGSVKADPQGVGVSLLAGPEDKEVYSSLSEPDRDSFGWTAVKCGYLWYSWCIL